MTFFGFKGKREFLPGYSYCNTLHKKRKLFLHLFNLVSKTVVFEKHDLCDSRKTPLFTLIEQKIAQFTTIASVQTKLVFFDAKLHRFIEKNGLGRIGINNTQPFGYKKALKISAFLNDDCDGVMIDSNLLFKSFVHKSITSLKRDRIVTDGVDCIDMHLKNDPDIKVLPFWQKDKKLNDAHIQKAVDCIKEGKFKNIYLVYPKEKDFAKHIDIKVPELEGCSEYVIKIIPYSLKTILRS
jgi:hypothetical protein